MNLIFVDDDVRVLRNIVCNFIIDYGLTENVSTTVSQGDINDLKRKINKNIDTVLFLDIELGLPYSGIYVANTILKKFKKVKVCFVSGLVLQFEKEINQLKENYSNRVCGVLDKPVDQKELVDVLLDVTSDIEFYDSKFDYPKDKIVFVDVPSFEMIVYGNYVKFDCKKSKQFLAEIVYAEGKEIDDETILNNVFYDINDKNKKSNRRHAYCLLKKTLKKYNCDDIIVECKNEALKGESNNRKYRLDYNKDKIELMWLVNQNTDSKNEIVY